jgi:hypothetical protein
MPDTRPQEKPRLLPVCGLVAMRHCPDAVYFAIQRCSDSHLALHHPTARVANDGE